MYAYVITCIQTNGVAGAKAAIEYLLHGLGGTVALSVAGDHAQHVRLAEEAPRFGRRAMAAVGFTLSEREEAAVEAARLIDLGTEVLVAIETGQAALMAELERQFLSGPEVPADVAFANRYLLRLQEIRDAAKLLLVTKTSMPLTAQIAVLVASIKREQVPAPIVGSWEVLAQYNRMDGLGPETLDWDPDFIQRNKEAKREGMRAALMAVLRDLIQELTLIRTQYVTRRVQTR